MCRRSESPRAATTPGGHAGPRPGRAPMRTWPTAIRRRPRPEPRDVRRAPRPRRARRGRPARVPQAGRPADEARPASRASTAAGSCATTIRDERCGARRPTSSSATSRPPAPTGCGSPTSPSCRRGAGFLLPRRRSSTPGAGGWSAGRWPTHMRDRARQRRPSTWPSAAVAGHGARPPLRPGHPVHEPRLRPQRCRESGIAASHGQRPATATTTPWPRASSPRLETELIDRSRLGEPGRGAGPPCSTTSRSSTTGSAGTAASATSVPSRVRGALSCRPTAAA